MIFDNKQVMHSVTPTDVYANGDHPTQRRLMVRTAMQPASVILTSNKRVMLRPLSSCGVDVVGIGAAEILSMLEAEDHSSSGSVKLIDQLASGLRDYGFLWLHAGSSGGDGSHSLSPEQIRGLYLRLHKARFPQIKTKDPKPEKDGEFSAAFKSSDSISRKRLDGYPEMTVLGYALELEDFHGVSGRLEPVAWWEKATGEWHQDGERLCILSCSYQATTILHTNASAKRFEDDKVNIVSLCVTCA